MVTLAYLLQVLQVAVEEVIEMVMMVVGWFASWGTVLVDFLLK